MDYVFTRHAVNSTLVRKGRGTVSPPLPPTNLAATPGDGQVSLNWSASPTSGLANYIVKRVNASQTVATVSGSVLSTVVTGLTNDVTYNFQVYAVSSTGQQSSPSNIATARPAAAVDPTPVTTMFGINIATNDGPNQTVAGRKALFNGRFPLTRTYNSSCFPATFEHTTATCPEKRVCTSFKTGRFSETQLADGTAQSAMQAYLNSIPNNWYVVWVYHHEVNNSSGMEVAPANFRNTYHQMMLAKQAVAANLASKNVELYVACNFNGYAMNLIKQNVSTWVPSPADCDWMTWDLYGNPGDFTSTTGSNKYGGPATGKAYGTTYPLPATKMADVWTITSQAGFADNWGVLEFNSPQRDWDTDNSGRLLWHQDMMALFMGGHPMAGAVPARIVLPWEEDALGVGVGAWNQRWDRLSSVTLMKNFWLPYMTGIPVGG